MDRRIGGKQALCLAVLSLMPITAFAAEKQARTDPQLANLVLQDCGSCHGITLKGGLGPPLRPENLQWLPTEAIAAIIHEGVPGTPMPPWKALLTPAEIDWISRQLKSGALLD